MQNFILFNDWVAFHCVCVYHVFFIHLSVDTHLDCFHVLTTVNDAAMNIGVCASFQKYLFFWMYTQEWNSWGMWYSIFRVFFEKASFCFLQWLHQFTFPPVVSTGSFFSTSLPIFVICVLSGDGHSDRCEVVSYSGFDLRLPLEYWCWILGICWPSACPLWKNICSFLLPILKSSYWILIPYQSYHLQIFSPIQ